MDYNLSDSAERVGRAVATYLLVGSRDKANGRTWGSGADEGVRPTV
jgi:hypothetical protein